MLSNLFFHLQKAVKNEVLENCWENKKKKGILHAGHLAQYTARG